MTNSEARLYADDAYQAGWDDGYEVACKYLGKYCLRLLDEQQILKDEIKRLNDELLEARVLI